MNSTQQADTPCGKQIVINVNCCCECVRSMFPPDRPIVIFEPVGETGMDFNFSMSDPAPADQVTVRTLVLTPDDGTTPVTMTFPVTQTWPVVITVTDNPGHTVTATAFDTNAIGAGSVSNAVTQPLGPIVPPPTTPPAAPTITFVPVTPGSAVGKAFRAFRR